VPLSFLKKDDNSFDIAKIASLGAAGAGIYGALNPGSKVGQFIGAGGGERPPIGYTGGIPEYEINRSLVPDAFSTTTPTGEPRRPGSAGRRYFTEAPLTPTGNVMSPAIPTPAAETQEQLLSKSQGIIDSLPPEIVERLIASMFSGSGISRQNFEPEFVPPPAATTPPPPPAATTGLPAGITPETVIEYVNREGVTPQDVRREMDAAGISVAQLANVLGMDAAEVQRQYDAAVATPTPTATFSDQDVLGFIQQAYTQYGGPGAEAHRAIAAAMNQYGVSPEQVARVTGIPLADVEADYKAFGYAQGGLASLKPKGYYLGGATDGMADEIPANIEGRQEAALSDGEFVIPADVVSHLGNGNSDAGAKQLYSMMDRVRQARTGRQEQGQRIAPNEFLPV
jgi:hypothetical protein